MERITEDPVRSALFKIAQDLTKPATLRNKAFQSMQAGWGDPRSKARQEQLEFNASLKGGEKHGQ